MHLPFQHTEGYACKQASNDGIHGKAPSHHSIRHGWMGYGVQAMNGPSAQATMCRYRDLPPYPTLPTLPYLQTGKESSERMNGPSRRNSTSCGRRGGLPTCTRTARAGAWPAPVLGSGEGMCVRVRVGCVKAGSRIHTDTHATPKERQTLHFPPFLRPIHPQHNTHPPPWRARRRWKTWRSRPGAGPGTGRPVVAWNLM